MSKKPPKEIQRLIASVLGVDGAVYIRLRGGTYEYKREHAAQYAKVPLVDTNLIDKIDQWWGGGIASEPIDVGVRNNGGGGGAPAAGARQDAAGSRRAHADANTDASANADANVDADADADADAADADADADADANVDVDADVDASEDLDGGRRQYKSANGVVGVKGVVGVRGAVGAKGIVGAKGVVGTIELSDRLRSGLQLSRGVVPVVCGSQVVHFGRFCDAFVAEAKQHFGVMGVCPWINNDNVLKTLLKMRICIVANTPASPCEIAVNRLSGGMPLFDDLPPLVLITKTPDKIGIVHGKFFVFVDKNRHPVALWRGSANLTNGAEYCNILEEASCSRDPATVGAYWNLLLGAVDVLRPELEA